MMIDDITSLPFPLNKWMMPTASCKTSSTFAYFSLKIVCSV